MKISVLRLGHRFHRDKRTTTHLALVARAFCADELILDSEDNEIEKSVKKVITTWGGNFKIKVEKNWRKFIENFSGEKIHLTMYGIPIDEKISEIRNSKKDKLVIVGGKKVPSEVYHLSDYNVAITQQPHSEIAALAIFLHEFFKGKELRKEFKGKKRIIPQERGKKVINT
ncbi:MAG: tRNA (cytidine(56)-2'-O)-methyltransferase [Candidatus Altiarchaeota archaeon]